MQTIEHTIAPRNPKVLEMYVASPGLRRGASVIGHLYGGLDPDRADKPLEVTRTALRVREAEGRDLCAGERIEARSSRRHNISAQIE